MKYLVYQKEFMMKHNIWKNKKNLENMKEIITEFKERISVEVKKVGEVRQSRIKRLQKERTIGKVHGKYVI